MEYILKLLHEGNTRLKILKNLNRDQKKDWKHCKVQKMSLRISQKYIWEKFKKKEKEKVDWPARKYLNKLVLKF